jgi:hypothetical protein
VPSAIAAASPLALERAASAEGARPAAPAGFKELLASTAAKPSTKLVPVTRTPLSTAQAQQALKSAWERVTGEVPNDATLALLTAQWAHETGHGASMYNYNFAGIKGSGPEGLSVAQRTREGFGETERRIVDNFRAYLSAEDGALDYVALLKRRYPEAVEAARAGDAGAFVRGLKTRGYFTGHEGAYLTSVASIAERVSGLEFSREPAPPSIVYGSGVMNGSAPAIDLHGLYAEMMPSTAEAYVDALNIADEISRAALRAFGNTSEEA